MVDKRALREASGGQIQAHIRPEASLVEGGPDLFAQLPSGLQREEGDRETIRHRPLRAQQGQRMTLAGPRAQLPQQGGVNNCQHLARQGLDIERELGLVGGHRIEDRQQLLSLGQGWPALRPRQDSGSAGDSASSRALPAR